MSEAAMGMDCGVAEWVKQSPLKWYGHVIRMNECDFTKRVYESRIEEWGVRGMGQRIGHGVGHSSRECMLWT